MRFGSGDAPDLFGMAGAVVSRPVPEAPVEEDGLELCALIEDCDVDDFCDWLLNGEGVQEGWLEKQAERVAALVSKAAGRIAAASHLVQREQH